MAHSPYRMLEVEREHGPLEDLIPRLANEHGLEYTARYLNVSIASISRWLKANRYKIKREYVKEDIRPT